MTPNLFDGQLVRLTAIDEDKDADALARWTFDTEFYQLLDSDPVRPATARRIKEDMEKRRDRRGNSFEFGIRPLAEEQLIGFTGLWLANLASGEAYVGIGIGEQAYWGKGFGTDAMRLVLRFAFAELNVERVSLQAFAYNTRALRSYEKAGFVREGLEREWVRRPNGRWDVVNMGILRREWTPS